MKDYLIGIYEKAMPNRLSLEEKLNCAKQFGYDFMEMSIDETAEKLERLDMSKEDRKEISRLSYETGIPVRSICLSGHRKYPLGSLFADTRQKSLDIMQKAIILAADLGVRIIQIAGYDVYYETSNEQTKTYFLENLKRSVELAAKHGVILAFETMETPFMDNVKKAVYYVKAINSPFLQVYPDIGNCTNASLIYGEDVKDDLLSGQGHLAAMHLKETVPGKYREIEFGTGHVNFNQAISTALALNVRMFVTEFWDKPQYDYLEHIAFSKNFIDKKFRQSAG